MMIGLSLFSALNIAYSARAVYCCYAIGPRHDDGLDLLASSSQHGLLMSAELFCAEDNDCYRLLRLATDGRLISCSVYELRAVMAMPEMQAPQ